MNNLYDLVRVSNPDTENESFRNGEGIITKIYNDGMIDILFIGSKLNDLSDAIGRQLFYPHEIEGI